MLSAKDGGYVELSHEVYELQMPISVSEVSILDELTEIICYAGNRDRYLTYDMVGIFKLAFYPIVEKLKVLCSATSQEKVRSLGIEMIKMLLAFDTNDDVFPEYEVAEICEVIGIEPPNEDVYGGDRTAWNGPV